MSESEASSSNNGTAEVTMFRCRKCGDKLFEESEKEEHRNWHREQKQKQKRRSQKSSVDGSSVATSLFVPTNQSGQAERLTARKRTGGKTRAEPSPKKTKKARKARSEKTYNKDHELKIVELVQKSGKKFVG